MTTEEKLKHFLDVTTESTNARNALTFPLLS